MTNLRRLNENGVSEFENYLIRAQVDATAAPPYHLLDDPEASTEFTLGEVDIERRSFASRREFAEYIDSRFRSAGIDQDVDSQGMWEWLSLYYFDVTCPLRSDGTRTVRKPNRYVLAPRSEVDPRRHLLRNAYLMHRQIGMHDPRAVDLLMWQSVDDYAKVVTHIGERKTLKESTGALYAARELFFDPEKARTKRNISDTRIGVQAFGTFLVNLPPEYDLTTLDSTTVLAILPGDFDAWIEDDRRRVEVQGLRRLMLRGGLHPESPPSAADQLQQPTSYERETAIVQRAVRDDLFRIEVLRAYDATCAVSGLGITYVPRSGNIRREVEAAHIVPVARGGRDVINNGLALNRTVHWAFDNGMIWIDDDYKIVVTENTLRHERNGWLSDYHGKHLTPPADQTSLPDPDYLMWHALHVAEAI